MKKGRQAPSVHQNMRSWSPLNTGAFYYPGLCACEPGSLLKNVPTRLFNVNLVSTTFATFQEKECLMDKDYQLQPRDVICGVRGSDEPRKHPGNARFHVIVRMRLERYKKATTKLEKSRIVKEIINAVRLSGGKFVRQVGKSSGDCHEGCAVLGQWVDIGDDKAREKAGHALRALLGRNEKSIVATTMNSMNTKKTCRGRRASAPRKQPPSMPMDYYLPSKNGLQLESDDEVTEDFTDDDFEELLLGLEREDGEDFCASVDNSLYKFPDLPTTCRMMLTQDLESII